MYKVTISYCVVLFLDRQKSKNLFVLIVPIFEGVHKIECDFLVKCVVENKNSALRSYVTARLELNFLKIIIYTLVDGRRENSLLHCK